ncbi:hypothetical protein FOA43_001770 [Brettanomyces nanus]|uniref:Brix domain-containing protein n=1 Tax=Eeniella nana TaxID=13502 RepID=A0A875RY71_EENNA|nr:uncharacterized protein FOA43_001770 [Brettanomyces nanus]QPG74441.1 hypothetical protein FOA43_001770 [Brettanomyces nanus]
MAIRRHKRRTHVVQTDKEYTSVPRSMVIHLGTAQKNHTLGQLVKDVRNMMQPHTAVKLRERRSNKVKDFVSVAGTFGVSFLMIFSQNEKTGGIHLRFAKMAHGPTISFKILEYSLCKDISRTLHNPKSLARGSVEYQSPPLLVLNGFTNPKEAASYEKLVITMFQNMFPAITPQTIKVGTIKRVLLINKDKKSGIIDVRHYAIDTKLVDVSRNVRKLVSMKNKRNKKIPNLSKVKDVADIILDPYAQAAFTSDSEVDTDAVVEVREEKEENVTKLKEKAEIKVDTMEEGEESGDVKRKKAVKLTEIGPRMRLELVKIEEEVCGGKVLYHSYIHKSEEEVELMDELQADKKKQKEQRKKQQRDNIEKKRKYKKVRFAGAGDAKKEGDDVEIDADADADADVDVDVDADVDISSSNSNSDDDRLFDE